MTRKRILAVIGLAVLSGFVVSVIRTMSSLAPTYAEQQLSVSHIGGVYMGNEGVLLQKNQNDCGPTSLQMIFDYYRIPSALRGTEASVGLTEKGSTMLALKAMAESRGLQVEGWRLTLQDFSKISFPALLFVHDDHYLVVDSLCNDSVFVRDPAIGKIRIPKKYLPKIWKGETLVFKKK